MHPFVASVIVNEITNDKAQQARHARQIRRRTRRAQARRTSVGR